MHDTVMNKIRRFEEMRALRRGVCIHICTFIYYCNEIFVSPCTIKGPLQPLTEKKSYWKNRVGPLLGLGRAQGVEVLRGVGVRIRPSGCKFRQWFLWLKESFNKRNCNYNIPIVFIPQPIRLLLL